MPRILHLGIGNFHRAHQAWYTQLSNAHDNDAWKITAVSLRRPDVRDTLAPQDFDYTLVIKGTADTEYLRINLHDEILVGPENPQAVVDHIADPDTTIVSLTVTEKGYYVDTRSGKFQAKDPVIAKEISEGKPSTAIGYLAFGLKARKLAHGKPITIMSCDNLSANGETLHGAVDAFQKAAGLDLSDYLQNSIAFPSAMVDRITPATTDELRAEVLDATGWADHSPVSTETFSEWTIEDNFAAERPSWDQVGVQIVADVAPYELRKLRLLNGPHSLLAYAGLFHGHRYVHEAIADPKLRGLAAGLMTEAAVTLPDEIQSSTPNYSNELIERFANPALKHELIQIAMDGSQKLPVRLLSTVKDRMQAGKKSPNALEGVAYWLIFVLSRSASGEAINDPQADTFLNIAKSSGTIREKLEAVLKVAEPDLASISELPALLDRAEAIMTG
ncbi:MAG: mannitol dehydrogenase family protein [Hyphomicrobiales bacterium]